MPWKTHRANIICTVFVISCRSLQLVVMHTTFKECKIIADRSCEMTTDNIYKLCRFCAKNKSCMVSIFCGQGLADELPSKIKTYLPVEVLETDVLPVKICKTCAQCLKMWDEFIVGCLKADEFLRILLEKSRENSLKNVDDSRQKKEKQLHDKFQSSHQQEKVVTPNTVDLTGLNETECTMEEELSSRQRTSSSPRLASQFGKNRIQNSIEVDNVPENIAETINTSLKLKDCLHNVSQSQITDNCAPKIFIKEKKCQHSVSHVSKQRKKITTNSGNNESSDYHMKMQNVQELNDSVTVLRDSKINKHCLKVYDFERQSSDKNESVSTISSFKSQDNATTNILSQYYKKTHEDKKSKHQKVKSNKNSEKESMYSETAKLLVKKTLKMRKQYKVSLHCNDCGKVFFHKESFNRHLRIHNNERPFICHTCGKGFRVSGALYRHLQHVHAGIKNFKCDICGKYFASKATCDDHRRTHTDERPFVCAVCGKSFHSKAGLYIHVKIHTDCFPYSCDLCEKHFRRNQELLAHRRIHTGERPFICDTCGKQFRVAGEMVRHKVVHSKDKPFSCAICGMNFRQKRYLRNHCKKHHINLQNSSS